MIRPHGARVKDVTPGTPAAAARLQAGDVILEYGGVTVDSDTHLISLVGLTEVGREVPLAVLRDKKVIKVNVKVGSGRRVELASVSLARVKTIKNALGAQWMEMLSDTRFEAATGGPVGYCGPVNTKCAKVLADLSRQLY